MTSNNNPVVYECKIDDSSNNNCNFVNIINNTEILNIIKDIIQSIYNPENCKSQIIKGDDNIVFQVTNGKNELDLLQGDSLDNQNISIIDLGTCETKLRKEYHINDNDSLIYLKQEKTNAKASEKNVQYEVFEPYNFTKLNLSICDGETVNIYVKLDLSEETQKIYENMKSMGYDMLNINDPFYQDICTPYNTENNTDIMLSDRIDYIYNNKDSQCQSNCDFSSYISNSLYINCSCSVVEEEKKEEEQFSGKKIYESFYEVLKYSNFQILKCFKLILTKKTFQKNLGSIIVLSSFLIYFACLIFFIIKGITPLKNKMGNILTNKEKKNDSINNNNNNKTGKKKKLKNVLHPVKKTNKKKRTSNLNDTKRKKQEKKNEMNFKKIKPKDSKKHFVLRNSLAINNINYSSKSQIGILYEKKQEKMNNIEKKETKKKLDAYELNELEYDEAIIHDKRSFLQIYWDLLSREHKIIFTFFIYNDYNILNIKYARFIFLLTTDMAMNVFFFLMKPCIKFF